MGEASAGSGAPGGEESLGGPFPFKWKGGVSQGRTSELLTEMKHQETLGDAPEWGSAFLSLW